MEAVSWKHILPYVKQLASGNLLYNAGSSNRCSVTTLRGRVGWEVGRKFKREMRYVYLWLIPVGICQKPIQYSKAIIFQLKITKIKRERESTCHCRGHGFSPWSEKIPHATCQLSPCATPTEPVLCDERSHCNKKPVHCNQRAALYSCNQRKKICTQQQKLNITKNKIKRYFFLSWDIALWKKNNRKKI